MDDVFASQLSLRNTRAALLTWMNIPLATSFDVVETLQTSGAAALLGRVRVSMVGPSGRRHSTLVRMSWLPAARSRVPIRETQLQRALRTPNVTVGGGYKRDSGQTRSCSR